MSDHEITVALIANSEDPYRQRIPREEWERPYKDRRKVQLTVPSSSTLADVMRQAARKLGVAPPPEQEPPPSLPAYRRIAFYKPEDEKTFGPRAMPQLHWAQLVLVDGEGRAVFGVSDQRSVAIEDLLQAAKAGVVDGDPLRPYLILEPGWGDVPPPDWPTVLMGLEVVWDVLNRVAVVGGVWAFGEMVLKRLSDRIAVGKKAAGEHREWAQRGTRPFQFVALVLTQDWKTEELAELLGCSVSEAEAVLWILGFSQHADTGTWSLSGDVEAGLIRDIQEQIAISSHRGGPNWDENLRQRILQLLESGESPPVNELRPEADSVIEDEWQPTAGERLRGLLDSVIQRLSNRS